MKEFVLQAIVKYWVQFLLTLITGALTFLCKKMYNIQKEERSKREDEERLNKERVALLETAMCAMLHDRLLHLLTLYLNQGEITADVLDNITILYKAYTGLGGNGTIQELYNRFKDKVKIQQPDYIGHFI